MSLISVTGLTFAYEGSYDTIFENVSFQIDSDWKLGFTGRNGRGKTTFLNLLMGKFSYQGIITASVVFEYFPYEVPDRTKNTAEIISEITGGYEEWQLARELSLLKVPEEVLHRPFQTLSNGEQTKLLLAGMFLRENSFLLIDEPTNHLDMEGRAILSSYLASKRGFILVSHDRAFLDNCVDHILSINRAAIEIQKGNFSSWWYNKELQDSFEREQDAKLKKEIGRLEQTMREKAKWADTAESRKIGFHPGDVEKTMGRRAEQGAKAKKAMKRAKALQNRQEAAIEEKSSLLKNLETAEELKISPLTYHSSRLLYLDDVAISYGEKSVCSGISFTIEQGDRVALYGKNGSGKSSILKLVCGEDIPHTGTVRVGSRLTVSYVPQDTGFLSGRLTEYASSYQIDESLFKAILRKLDFQRVQFEKDMSDFSGGQKKKVLIARSLCEKANLYVWDEPLNFIDVLSRMQIEELLKEYKPTILFVEHDRAFCKNIATKIVKL